MACRIGTVRHRALVLDIAWASGRTARLVCSYALPTKLSCVLYLSPTLSYWLGDVRDGAVAARRGDAVRYNQ
ncbi:hypothetical protein ALMP_73750 [Streptomyces sp. A012304]|nr:hypothetical protein ALMP_73750 [Streptomyces sp. A012304]